MWMNMLHKCKFPPTDLYITKLGFPTFTECKHIVNHLMKFPKSVCCKIT